MDYFSHQLFFPQYLFLFPRNCKFCVSDDIPHCECRMSVSMMCPHAKISKAMVTPWWMKNLKQTLKRRLQSKVLHGWEMEGRTEGGPIIVHFVTITCRCCVLRNNLTSHCEKGEKKRRGTKKAAQHWVKMCQRDD